MSTYVAQPYVGITGISTPWEIEAITSKWFEVFDWTETDRRFMNGILVSSKSLRGEAPSDPQQYPDLGRARHLMVDDPRVMNTVHFNISGLTERPSRVLKLGSYLSRVVERLPATEAIQINLAWPSVDLLKGFREDHSQLIILQIGAAAYEALGHDPGRLVAVLEHYCGVADYVLIDPSGGTGQPFNLSLALRTLDALAGSDLPMLWGIAGGLGPNSLGRLKKLVELYPNLSWDAQGRLRDGEGHLGWAETFAYLKGSLALARR
ncbi:MAG TPA: hypothetical protein VLF21_01870 [Candidatus Saccharimonadales bacterium]|nr:hypothetical protein [Candidatus Saccharimonadales bacterium]